MLMCDQSLQISYTSENVTEGKRAAKEALQRRLGLKRADLPLVGIITRLTHQKGIHLIKHAIWRTLDRGGQVVYFQLLHLLVGSKTNWYVSLHSLSNEWIWLFTGYDTANMMKFRSSPKEDENLNFWCANPLKNIYLNFPSSHQFCVFIHDVNFLSGWFWGIRQVSMGLLSTDSDFCKSCF